jgi:hypothetical protein
MPLPRRDVARPPPQLLPLPLLLVLVVAGMMIVSSSANSAASAAAATVSCRQCYRSGCRTWACPLGQFCGDVGQCSASVSPSSASSLPKYGCNLIPTQAAPIKVTCPVGYSCCSQSGPFAPVDNLTNFCRDSSHSAGQFCCGAGLPCDKNQRCCSSTSSAIKAMSPRAHEERHIGVLLAQAGDLCVDVTAPPPPPPGPGNLPAPSWSGPGSCCQDPKYHNLSYTCRSGSCCGTDPSKGINEGSNDCIDPETEQCCSGKDDPVFPCPRCGYGCPKQQTCGKNLGSCDTSSTCKRLLTTICGWAHKQSPASCFECIGANAAIFENDCFNKTMPGKGEGDFERFCDGARNKVATTTDWPSAGNTVRRKVELQKDVDVCMDARWHANSSGIVYLGTFPDHTQCVAAVLRLPMSTAMFYCDKDFVQAGSSSQYQTDVSGGSVEGSSADKTAAIKSWADSCYARTDGKYAAKKRKHCTSGRVTSDPPPPAPSPPSPSPQPAPPPPTKGCALNCSMNGVCVDGKCACDAAWIGSHCQTLDLLPATRDSGLRQFGVAAGGPPGTIAGNTSTWGGATLYDPSLGRWFMWATELTGHCGMHTWTTNSHTVRASSADPLGLYSREAEQFPIWSHEVDVVRDPASGRYVAYYSRMATGKAPPCTSCMDGSTAKSCKKIPSKGSLLEQPDPHVAGPAIEVSPPTYMAYSKTVDPRGEWSTPAEILMPKPQMDINAAPVILPDGSVVGLWRDHHPSKKYSTPHLFHATNWSDPKTYTYSSEPVFSTKDVKGPIEDMFLYRDKRGGFHCLFHLMYGCDNCGSHAFSTDGARWTYTGVAYTSLTKYTDGSTVEYPYCERPHLIFDHTGDPIVGSGSYR